MSENKVVRLFNSLDWKIFPMQIFVFAFWFNAFFNDKLMGLLHNPTFYSGMVKSMDKFWAPHPLTHLLMPLIPILFAVIILLEGLTFLSSVMTFLNGEFLTCRRDKKWSYITLTCNIVTASALAFGSYASAAPYAANTLQCLAWGYLFLIFLKMYYPRPSK